MSGCSTNKDILLMILLTGISLHDCSNCIVMFLTLSDLGYLRQLTIPGLGASKSPPISISKTINYFWGKVSNA